jgi:hypothetical protein
VCVRARATDDGRYLALLGETALLTDRFRLGDRARFVVHVDGETPTMCGTASVALIGRLGADGVISPELPRATATVARLLVEDAPFRVQGCVLVALAPDDVRIDEGDVPSHGAVPRT